MHNTNCNEQVKKKDNKKWWRYSAQDRNLLAVKWPAKLINAPSELRRYTVIAQECNVNLKQLKNSNSEKKAVLIWNNSVVENQKQKYFWHLIRPHPCPECALPETSKGTAFSVFSAYTLLSKSSSLHRCRIHLHVLGAQYIFDRQQWVIEPSIVFLEWPSRHW